MVLALFCFLFGCVRHPSGFIKNGQSRSGIAHCRLSKKLKSVTIGGPAPTMVTPTGKFCGKLCARSKATSARFPVKFCREGFQKGEPDGQAKPCRTGPPFAACRVSRHAEMGNPDPGLPIDLQRIPLFSAPIVTGLVQSLRSASPLSAQRTGLAAPYWSMGFIVGIFLGFTVSRFVALHGAVFQQTPSFMMPCNAS